MEWNSQQAQALKQIDHWVKHEPDKQVLRLFGWAGTGKTTLAQHVAADVKGEVTFGAYTGKAALVLRSKGCESASTLHSLIYRCFQDKHTGKFSFGLNRDSVLGTTKLLIVDEVSYVNEKMAKDILSFGCKVLVLGDPGQLPPIKGEGYFIQAEPDVMLTDVRRSAKDSPIIALSAMAREGTAIAPGWYGNCLVANRADVNKDKMSQIALESDQILCGTNNTRKAFNARLRTLLGRSGYHEDWHPVEGDRLVCLKNNHERQLLNGSLWDVSGVFGASDTIDMSIVSLDMPETIEDVVTVPAEFFEGTDDKLDWRVLRNFEQFTYGYCLTVHKAQGSEWPKLLVSDESARFGEVARNHLYTAITRASEQLTLIV